MTSGFGVDPTADGSSGTQSSDIRKIFGGIYTPGVISGATITTSGSAMQYTVSSGVAAIGTATGEVVLAPIPITTVTASSAPISGTRTDIVYVQQRYPSIEGDANVVVGVGTVLPVRAVALGTFVVSAGQTNTNAAVKTGSVNYSIPYGASLGVLWYHHFQYSGAISSSIGRYGSGSIYLPTDRRVRYTITAGAMYANGASGFDNSKYCEVGFLPSYDGGDFVLWTTPGLHQSWQSLQYSAAINLSAGTHTVNYGMFRNQGPGTPMMFTGGSGGFGRRGVEFTIEDLGPTI